MLHRTKNEQSTTKAQNQGRPKPTVNERLAGEFDRMAAAANDAARRADLDFFASLA